MLCHLSMEQPISTAHTLDPYQQLVIHHDQFKFHSYNTNRVLDCSFCRGGGLWISMPGMAVWLRLYTSLQCPLLREGLAALLSCPVWPCVKCLPAPIPLRYG